MLHREVLRQGLLIAARDGLGISTRDQTLREPFVDADGRKIEPLDIKTNVNYRGKAVVELRHAAADKRPIWESTYRFTSNSYDTYVTLPNVIEKASRTDMVEVLRGLGYEGEPNRSAESAEIPAEIEGHLAQMNFVPQFAAVRWAHEDIRRRGESASSLGVLVRGYSHLSLLTEFYWNGMHLVYKARALLYAERMVARHPDSIEALWHRAYARSMIGIHKAALDQLKAIAERTGAEEPDYDALPTCMRIVDARCRYDVDQFRAIASKHDSLRPLAHLLMFRTCELRRLPKLLGGAADEALEHCPDAYGIFYTLYYRSDAALYYRGDQQMRRSAVEGGSAAFGEHFTNRMYDVGNLPDAVEDVLSMDGIGDEPPASYEIARALVSAGAVGRDVDEPSWGVLGRMAQEVTFVQATIVLREEACEYRPSLVEEVAPFVEDHPYAPIIETFAVNSEEQPGRCSELLKNIQIFDPQYHMRPLLRWVYYVRTPTMTNGIGRTASSARTCEYTAYSIFDKLALLGPTKVASTRGRTLWDMNNICPHSPEMLRVSIILTPEPTAEQLAEWDELAEGSTALLYQLGRAYARVDGHEGTVRCLEQAVDRYPTKQVFTLLAEAYAKLGRDDLWLATLKKQLARREAIGAYGHNDVRIRIVEGLMERGRWEEAKPLAVASGRSSDFREMTCAANYWEGVGNLKESQKLVQRSAETFRGAYHLAWYLWCRRNGKTDVEQCRPFALAYATKPRVPNRDFYPHAGAVLLLEGRREEALKVFLKNFAPEKRLLSFAHVLLLAAELNKPDVRDEWLVKLFEAYDTMNPENQSIETRYARILEASFGSTPPKKPDRAAVKRVLDEADPILATQIGYVIGRTFELCGDRPTAEEYYRKTVEQVKFQEIGRTLAAVRLREKPKTEEEP